MGIFIGNGTNSKLIHVTNKNTSLDRIANGNSYYGETTFLSTSNFIKFIRIEEVPGVDRYYDGIYRQTNYPFSDDLSSKFLDSNYLMIILYQDKNGKYYTSSDLPITSNAAYEEQIAFNYIHMNSKLTASLGGRVHTLFKNTKLTVIHLAYDKFDDILDINISGKDIKFNNKSITKTKFLSIGSSNKYDIVFNTDSVQLQITNSAVDRPDFQGVEITNDGIFGNMDGNLYNIFPSTFNLSSMTSNLTTITGKRRSYTLPDGPSIFMVTVHMPGMYQGNRIVGNTCRMLVNVNDDRCSRAYIQEYFDTEGYQSFIIYIYVCGKDITMRFYSWEQDDFVYPLPVSDYDGDYDKPGDFFSYIYIDKISFAAIY